MPRLSDNIRPYVFQIDPKNPTEIVTSVVSTTTHPGDDDELVFDAASLLTLVSDRGAATFDFGIDVVVYSDGNQISDPLADLEAQRERLKTFTEAICHFSKAAERQIDDAIDRIKEFKS